MQVTSLSSPLAAAQPFDSHQNINESSGGSEDRPDDRRWSSRRLPRFDFARPQLRKIAEGIEHRLETPCLLQRLQQRIELSVRESDGAPQREQFVECPRSLEIEIEVNLIPERRLLDGGLRNLDLALFTFESIPGNQASIHAREIMSERIAIPLLIAVQKDMPGRRRRAM